MRGREEGFTLVELMVVIVIIGLLTTIVVINVLPSQEKARVEKAKADVALIEQGLEMYRLDNLNYPATGEGLQALVTPPAAGAQAGRYRAGGYLKKLPADPWGNPTNMPIPASTARSTSTVSAPTAGREVRATMRTSATGNSLLRDRAAEHGFTSLWRSAEHGFTSLWRSAEHGFTSLWRSAEHGFTSLWRSAEHGFTLVELMVVLAIMGLAAAAVVVAMPDPRGSLQDDAERFAARAHAAQDAAMIEAHDMALSVRADGYGFERYEHGHWRALADKPFGPAAWAKGAQALVGDAGTARVVFDTTGGAAALDVTLVRDAQRVRIHLDADGTIRVAS